MMRTPLAATALLALTACASSTAGPRFAPVQTLNARLISAEEISIFIGDVEGIGYSYRFERLDPPGGILTAIALERCPADTPQGQSYALQIQRQTMAIGLRVGQSEAIASDFALLSCKAL